MWGMMGESQCVLGSVGHPVRRRIHATTVAGFPTLPKRCSRAPGVLELRAPRLPDRPPPSVEGKGEGGGGSMGSMTSGYLILHLP